LGARAQAACWSGRTGRAVGWRGGGPGGGVAAAGAPASVCPRL